MACWGEPRKSEESNSRKERRATDSRDTLARLCSLERGRFHCYSGYAGWGPGQLEREIGEGTWLVSAADPKLVLEARPEDVWSRSLHAMGIDPASLVSGGAGEA